VGEATNQQRRGENRRHGAENRPTLAINQPGRDGGAASRIVSEICLEIIGKLVKNGDF
jgi:hypothetical protein